MSFPRSKRLALLRARNRGGTSDYALLGLEQALARRLPYVDNDPWAVRFVARVLKNVRLQGAFWHRPDVAYILALMGPQTFRAFPQGLTSEIIPFAFDCWPADYDEWERFLRAYRVRTAFFTARQSADHLRERIGGLNAIWMPEAVDPQPFRDSVPLPARRIDLLELGRRSETFHERIKSHCEARGYVHLYQRTARGLVFPTRKEFVEGMAQTKILVCFPSSMTHPHRSGDVETMTLRYLEGIASGCILLGHCPEELRDLFGYDPVIAADPQNLDRQLDAILHAPATFMPLTARNSARLREVATWDRRGAAMLDLLARHGYTFAGVGA